ncbi:mutator type transposase, partial [Tanacetum coccineum]
MPASMEARIAEHAVAPIPPTSPTYDQAPLGHRAAMIRMRDDIPKEDMSPRRRFVLTAPPPGCDVVESSTAAAARAPRGQYDFVDAVEAGQGLIRSPGHDVRTIARGADRAEVVATQDENVEWTECTEKEVQVPPPFEYEEVDLEEFGSGTESDDPECERKRALKKLAKAHRPVDGLVYSDNFYIGQCLANKTLIKEMVSKIAVAQRRQLWLSRNDKTRMTAECRGKVPVFNDGGPVCKESGPLENKPKGDSVKCNKKSKKIGQVGESIKCPWLVHCTKSSKAETWWVRKFNDNHTCLQSRSIGKCTASFLSKEIEEAIKPDPRVPIASLKDQLQRKYELGLSDMKIFRAKQMAEERLFGDWASKRTYICWVLLKNGFKGAGKQRSLGTYGLFLCHGGDSYPRTIFDCCWVDDLEFSETPTSPSKQIGKSITMYMKLQWRGEQYKDLLWRSATATTVQRFGKNMEEIKKLNPEMYNWLKDIPPQHWARSHFSGRPHCDVLLNNMCEVLNRQLLKGRDKPIVTCLEFIREYLMKRIVIVQGIIDKSTGPLTPNATKLFNLIKRDAAQYKVIWNGGDLKWEITGMPCKHAVASIWNMANNGLEPGIPESWVHESYCSTIVQAKDSQAPPSSSQAFTNHHKIHLILTTTAIKKEEMFNAKDADYVPKKKVKSPGPIAVLGLPNKVTWLLQGEKKNGIRVRFDMSSDNTSSTVTYTSISSNLNGPSSWGIPLENAGEILDMDPARAPRASRTITEMMPVEDQPYAKDASPTAELPGYIADSDLMEDDIDTDSIDYPNEPRTDDEDEDKDPEEDLSKEHEPKDEGAKEDESSEDSDETESFEENETAATPPPPRLPQTRIPFSQTRLRRARKTVRIEPSMPASMEARIAEHADGTILLPLAPTYDMHHWVIGAHDPSAAAAAARAPRGQYDFVDTIRARQALQTSEHRMMTSIEEVNLRVSYQAQVRRQESEIFYTQLHDARTDRKDIRLEIDVVRGQRSVYEIELHEVRQAYLSSKARNRALLVRLKTLETHMSRMEWQRQRAEDDAVRQIMRTQ